MKATKVMLWIVTRLFSMAILVILFALITTAAQAFSGVLQASGEQSNLLTKFLLWLTTGGSVVAVSWVAERNKWFQSLDSQNKAYIQYGASTALGIAALLVQTYVPETTLLTLTPYFAVISGVFGMVFLNQVAHVNDPARTRLH